MNRKINTWAFAAAASIVAAVGMLVLSVAGILGLYTGAVEMMSR